MGPRSRVVVRDYVVDRDSRGLRTILSFNIDNKYKAHRSRREVLGPVYILTSTSPNTFYRLCSFGANRLVSCPTSHRYLSRWDPNWEGIGERMGMRLQIGQRELRMRLGFVWDMYTSTPPIHFP